MANGGRWSRGIGPARPSRRGSVVGREAPPSGGAPLVPGPGLSGRPAPSSGAGDAGVGVRRLGLAGAGPAFVCGAGLHLWGADARAFPHAHGPARARRRPGRLLHGRGGQVAPWGGFPAPGPLPPIRRFSTAAGRLCTALFHTHHNILWPRQGNPTTCWGQGVGSGRGPVRAEDPETRPSPRRTGLRGPRVDAALGTDPNPGGNGVSAGDRPPTSARGSDGACRAPRAASAPPRSAPAPRRRSPPRGAPSSWRRRWGR